jgi:Na+/citrate or Na+/malate symporter
MDFRESKTYLLIFIAIIIVGTLLSFNIEDQIEDPDHYIRMRDE